MVERKYTIENAKFTCNCDWRVLEGEFTVIEHVCEAFAKHIARALNRDELHEEMARLIMDYPGGETNLPPEEYKAGLVRWCLAREAVVVKLEEG